MMVEETAKFECANVQIGECANGLNYLMSRTLVRINCLRKETINII